MSLMQTRTIALLIDAECNVRYALKDYQESEYQTPPFTNSPLRVGYILKLSLSGQDLVADTQVTGPLDPDKKLSAVGVLDRIRWDGLENAPLELSGRISPKNKSILHEALCFHAEGLVLEVELVIYDYDHHAKKYFRSFYTDGNPIKCNITENTRAYLCPDPDIYVSAPVNFIFDLSLTADRKSRNQTINCSFSADGRVQAKQFG